MGLSCVHPTTELDKATFKLIDPLANPKQVSPQPAAASKSDQPEYRRDNEKDNSQQRY
ncbi:MAG: hypothetical protein ACYSTL_05270 [Planctomycetota bacterium]